MHDSKVTNILLIGVDGSSSDTSLRSDTMLMVSIDRNNKKIKLTSFPARYMGCYSVNKVL